MKIMEMMLGVVMGVVDMEVDKWPMRWRTGPTLLMWPWRAKIPIECFTGVTLAIEMMLEVEVDMKVDKVADEAHGAWQGGYSGRRS